MTAQNSNTVVRLLLFAVIRLHRESHDRDIIVLLGEINILKELFPKFVYIEQVF